MNDQASAVAAAEPTRADVDALPGETLLEFGASWCGYCQAARPIIALVLKQRPGLQHVRVEDGKGRPLGRSFGVKLWPTLVYLVDGREVNRVVRPVDIAQLQGLFAGVQSEARHTQHD